MIRDQRELDIYAAYYPAFLQNCVPQIKDMDTTIEQLSKFDSLTSIQFEISRVNIEISGLPQLESRLKDANPEKDVRTLFKRHFNPGYTNEALADRVTKYAEGYDVSTFGLSHPLQEGSYPAEAERMRETIRMGLGMAYKDADAAQSMVIEGIRGLQDIALRYLSDARMGLDERLELLRTTSGEVKVEAVKMIGKLKQDRKKILQSQRLEGEEDERMALFEGYSKQPTFKRFYEAYRKAAERARSEPNDQLRDAEFMSLFTRYAGGNGYSDTSRLKAAHEWAYLLFDLNNNPILNEDHSPLTLEQLFGIEGLEKSRLTLFERILQTIFC